MSTQDHHWTYIYLVDLTLRMLHTVYLYQFSPAKISWFGKKYFEVSLPYMDMVAILAKAAKTVGSWWKLAEGFQRSLFAIWAPSENEPSGIMRTAKAQISLRICAVWSGPSLSANNHWILQNVCMESQVLSVKKQLHDVGTEIYLHIYNNEKRERDRFIKKKSWVSNPQPSAW